MKLRGFMRAQIVYAVVIMTIGYIALPSNEVLAASLSQPSDFHLISEVAGLAEGPFDTREVLFSRLDCALGTTRIVHRVPEKPKPGSLEERYNFLESAPYYEVNCQGHERRSEVLFFTMMALVLPALAVLAGKWIRRGFASDE